MTVAAYRDRSSGAYPITADQVRSRSMMLYGDTPPQAALDGANVEPVETADPPAYDTETQTIAEGQPVKQSGKWVQTWQVTDIPVSPTANFIPVPLLRQRLEKLGLFEDFSAYLAQYPVMMLKVLSLESGVDPTYPDLLVAFDSMNVPQNARDYLLAPPSVGVPDV